jgi:FtsZ-interacting cell division protein YlmF
MCYQTNNYGRQEGAQEQRSLPRRPAYLSTNSSTSELHLTPNETEFHLNNYQKVLKSKLINYKRVDEQAKIIIDHPREQYQRNN